MPEENNHIEFLIPIGFSIALLLIFAVAFVVFLLAFQRRKFKDAREKERLKTEFEQELLRSTLEIQETTQNMIGRDLHDNIGQVLAVAKLYVSSAADGLQGEQKEKASKAEEMIRKAMQDIRTYSHALNAEKIGAKGLSNALRELVRQINQSGKVVCELEESGSVLPIDARHTVILFRICQELINNALKHANTERIDLDLVWKDSEVEIRIRDHGEGFFKDAMQPGHGLQNIESRTRLLKADFILDSSPGAGTEARITYRPRP
jgi:signal transduction histidine kinase